MEFVSVFDEASRDLEAEGHERAHTAAAQEASEATWPFLRLASSKAEFSHRLALVEDRLSAIAAHHGVDLAEVVSPLEKGFEATLTAKQAASGSSYEEQGLHGVVGVPDRNEDGSPMRFQCPGCYDGAGGWFDLEHGYQKCPACDGHGSVHRIPKVENPVHKTDYHFVPAPKMSATASTVKCALCGHSAAEHVDGKDCQACSCTDFTPKTKTSSLNDSFDARIAKIHQALQEGVDPLALITEINGAPSQQPPTHHMETQVFEGQNPVAFDAAQQGGGSAQPENAGGHSIAPEASRPFA